MHADDGTVIGVRIGDMGVAKDGSHKPGYTAGIDIRAKVTVLAEGARGSLTKQLIQRFELDADSDPQGYSIGIKELWQVPEDRVSPGKIVHSFGWPADSKTYGGSFLYHLDQGRIALGYVSGSTTRSDYNRGKPSSNEPPMVKPLLEGAPSSSAGARRDRDCVGYPCRCRVRCPRLRSRHRRPLNLPRSRAPTSDPQRMLSASTGGLATGTDGFDGKLRSRSRCGTEEGPQRNPGFKPGCGSAC